VSQFDINSLYKVDTEVTIPSVIFKQGIFVVASTLFVKLSCSLFDSGLCSMPDFYVVATLISCSAIIHSTGWYLPYVRT